MTTKSHYLYVLRQMQHNNGIQDSMSSIKLYFESRDYETGINRPREPTNINFHKLHREFPRRREPPR